MFYMISILVISIGVIISQPADTLSFVPPRNISDKFRNDLVAIDLASTDYGHIVQKKPAAVFYPTSTDDIRSLIQFANNNSSPLGIAARGHGHSVRGQCMTDNGVVVNMTNLINHKSGPGIFISQTPALGSYADVGGEQLWIDVLTQTLKRGLSPVSWTDYLYLSVGGTLSNAGIGGQTFRFGPQISNVFELDVITGKGDFVTCSKDKSPELFYAVLGGLGQFGIITRARIALQPALKRVKWIRMLYNDFSAISRDQERLISLNGRGEKDGVDYLEGLLLMRQGPLDVSSYPKSDQPKIVSLVTQYGIIYLLELAKYYDDSTRDSVDKELQVLVKGLSFVPGFYFAKDVEYIYFLNRVHYDELILRKQGLWDVPHPWLNIFLPKSRISDFDFGVFKNILLKESVTVGIVKFYPMNRNKWEDKMSCVIPDEDVFYTVALLYSTRIFDWEAYDAVNKQLLEFCEKNGIPVKQYLPYYETQRDWINHFGSKWTNFQEMKANFDPNKILSPGQRIFN
ncbi:cytokinin dehydrogenase 2 [Ziziphus jujuba]|uniref:cytokinin dehydrogenase n=1 Tax=Ziziphus jujuba TaxID=326968 RepID=A0A6P6GG13_ZIZJJ|nr:cytokinin dehydrogenase 2 [Ziziphus jujuba]